MSDPLDAVFVTGAEAAELKRADTARKLAAYLERMPIELRGMFAKEFQRINHAELAQLRADLHAARERIAEQARQLDEARNLIIRSGRVINNLKKPDSVYDLTGDLLDWLAANPAPEAEPQP